MKKPGFIPVIKLSLTSLTIDGLSIGMTEFLMMGGLQDISRTLQYNHPRSGTFNFHLVLAVIRLP